MATNKKRKRRKNADDALRAAERAYTRLSPHDPDKIAARVRYWREAIRAGQIPKPSKTLRIPGIGDDRFWFLYMNFVPDVPGGNEHGYFIGKDNTRVSCIFDGFYENRWVVTLATHEQPVWKEPVYSKEEQDEHILAGLNALIDHYERNTQENPRTRRKNADESLRKLERAYQQDPTTENQLRWRALLKRDQLPVPSSGKFDFDKSGRMVWKISRTCWAALWDDAWRSSDRSGPYWVTVVTWNGQPGSEVVELKLPSEDSGSHYKYQKTVATLAEGYELVKQALRIVLGNEGRLE